MTTVIVTGVPVLHAGLSYHRRLRRYVMEVAGEGVTVEFVLTREQARRLLDELREQEHRVTTGAAETSDPRGTGKDEQR